MIVLVGPIEPLVSGIPSVLQSAVIVISIGPRHRAVGWVTTTYVRVLVIHVVERARGWLQLRVVGRLLARSIAIRHALACAPGAIADVGGEAGQVLRVLIGPSVIGC